MNQLNLLKRKVMGIEKIKEILHLRIEEADERLLRVFHAMTEAYNNPSEADPSEAEITAILPPPGKRLTKEEFISEIKEADAQIDRGEFITSEELEKEMEKW